MLFDVLSLQQVRKTVDSEGLLVGSKKLFSILHIPSVTAKGSCPSKGPTLIIANHNGVFDTHVLIQTIKRTDYKFIALAIYQIFGNDVKSKLFPIYRHIPWLHRFYEFPLQYEVIGTLPKIYDHEDARIQNKKTIMQAAKWVSAGGMLSLFPTGSVGKTYGGYAWKTGVGYLVKQITNPKTQVIFAHIVGTRKTDVIAYLNPLLRKVLFRPRPLQIEFSNPHLLSNLVDKTDSGRKIAQKLEREYNKTFGITDR